jgi:hypothetical protein
MVCSLPGAHQVAVAAGGGPQFGFRVQPSSRALATSRNSSTPMPSPDAAAEPSSRARSSGSPARAVRRELIDRETLDRLKSGISAGSGPGGGFVGFLWGTL